jgi:hypothetical protein
MPRRISRDKVFLGCGAKRRPKSKWRGVIGKK